MFILKKLPRPHRTGEPLLHASHKRPVTRRDFLAAGLLPSAGAVIVPSWLAALLTSRPAHATLAADIAALAAKGQCGAAGAGTGMIPFIVFDLAGGANLVGSEVIVGTSGGQQNFLSTAGYGLMGLPGNLVPSVSSSFVNSSLGLLWHSDGAILRGILSKATTPATAAGTNGAVICAQSQNDTGVNQLNPMYGIATAGPGGVGARGQLLNLIGTQSSISGGNSAAPAYMIQASLQPAVITEPSDATALVNTGGASGDPVSVAVLESQARITGGTTPYNSTSQDPSVFTGALTAPSGSTPGVLLNTASTATDAQLKEQVRCAYVGSAYTADTFGNPAVLDPTQDTHITGGSTPIFTASDFTSNPDAAATATIMKLVLNGYASAGTITMASFDYHDGTRATGETRNYQAGQMIGAVLEYAQRIGTPVMIYVLTDGSLSSNSTIDNSTAGRGKLCWQGDNESVASTFFLVYSPKGRPQPRNGAASQQIGYFTSGGAVVTTATPASNSVVQVAETVILNYLGLQGLDGQFSTFFPQQGLGPTATQQSMTAFAPIV